MPDFTRISRAELDIDRNIYSKSCTVVALRSLEDSSGFEPIPGFWDGDGVLKRGFCPYDYHDGVNLRVKIAEFKPLNEEILLKIEAFAFSRGKIDRVQQPLKLYSVSATEYEERMSTRVWVFSSEILNRSKIWTPPVSDFAGELTGIFGITSWE